MWVNILSAIEFSWYNLIHFYMISFKLETTVQAPFGIVVNNFSEELFQALAPSFPPSKLISFDGDRVGGLVKIQLGIAPVSQLWISEIISRKASDELVEFVDKGIQLPIPLKEWEHRHVIKKISDEETMIIDDIKCTSGAGLVDLMMKPFLKMMFSQRTPVYQRYFRDLTKKSDR